ncbi:MAG: sugar phosphate isomerase/epimerase, partial [Gemmatimonadetes bacterium]|nr:sugar phosphate isomerase/epimerase [Gemmatimonadota bacterium]
TDADRVYPGDGLAPWQQIVTALDGIGFEGMLSLELFNESYWAKGPEVVAREGLAKLKACVEAA